MIELGQKIIEIEHNYLNLLETIDEKTTDSNMISLLDSVRLFWYKNRKIISLFLLSLQNKNAFFYSGVTHLDVNDKEYYGFLACGKIHIMDDQLYKYAETILLGTKAPGLELIKNQFYITLHDNLSVLKSLSNIIYLLPVRLFFTDNNKLFMLAEKIFLSLFDDKFSSKEDFLKNCKTADDININIRDDLKNKLLFYKNDDLDMPFTVRINGISEKIYGNYEINFRFLFCLIGYIAQALEIIECMHRFNIIPVIRSKESLSYVLLLESNIPDVNIYINKIILSNNIFALINKNLNIFEDKTPKEITDIFDKNDLFIKFYNYFDLYKKSILDIPLKERIQIIEKDILSII